MTEGPPNKSFFVQRSDVLPGSMRTDQPAKHLKAPTGWCGFSPRNSLHPDHVNVTFVEVTEYCLATYRIAIYVRGSRIVPRLVTNARLSRDFRH